MSDDRWYPARGKSPSRYCCPDFTKRVCFSCRGDIRVRLHMLSANLAVAGALCAAFDCGWDAHSLYDDGDHRHWHPGCGREVPR